MATYIQILIHCQFHSMWLDGHVIPITSFIQINYMDATMIGELSTLYGYLYSDFDPLSISFHVAGRTRYSDHIIHSSMARTDKGSIISAYWPTTGVNEMNTLCASQSMGDFHFGVVKYFFEHTITRNHTESKTHIFACVKCARPHAQHSTGLVSQQQYVKMILKTPVFVIIFLFKELFLSMPMLTFN